jgi:putative MATE family efflux protein
MEAVHKNDKSKEFSTGNTFALIIKFSIPTIIGMIVNALYTVIDRIFVGNLPNGEGTLGIAGIAISTPVTIILFAVAMLSGAGGAANISLCLGRGKRDEAERFIGNGIVLGVFITLIVSITFIVFRIPILKLFGASDAVLPYAEKYLTIMLIGTTINTFAFTLSRYILAQGFSTVSMVTLVLSVIVNVILAPLFLFVFHMGIAGSALATVIAQTSSACFSLWYFTRNRMPLKIRTNYLKPDFGVIKLIAAIGISPCALQLAMSLVQVIMNNSLQKYGGDVAVAAMGTVTAVSLMLMMPIYGINQGVQPIIGFNYGAKLYHRVHKLLVQAIISATCLITLFWLVVMFGAEAIIKLFGADNINLIKEGPPAIRMFLALLPLVGFQVVSSNYFQAIGKPKYSLLLSLSRQVLFLIPAVLIVPLFFKLNGVYLAGPVADFISTVLTAIFFIFELKHLKKLSAEMDDNNELLIEN